jgi:hypothetical protein
VTVNPAEMVPGVRYQWKGIYPCSGTFVRYEVSAGALLAIFIDFAPLFLDNTAETEMCVGMSGLIRFGGITEVEQDDGVASLVCHRPACGTPMDGSRGHAPHPGTLCANPYCLCTAGEE